MSAPEAARPRVTLKLATSLDGRIALANGASRWITGEGARSAVHRLRAEHDAVITGVGTVLADDPQMTARPGGEPSERQPVRVIMDSRLRTPPDAQVIRAGAAPCLIYAAHRDDRAERRLKAAGAMIRHVHRDGQDRPDWAEVLADLGRDGAARVMIEAGGGLAGSAMLAGVVDRIEWFRAPIALGGDARGVFGAFGLSSLTDAPRYVRSGLRELGPDLHETYERA